MNRPDIFNIGEIRVEDSDFDETKRLTLDYPEDYQLLKTLYQLQDKEIPNLMEILNILSKKNELWKVNGNRKQTMYSSEELSEIESWFESQKKYIKQMAKDMGINLFPGHSIRKEYLYK